MIWYLTPLQFRWAMAGLTFSLLLLAAGAVLPSVPVTLELKPYNSEHCQITQGQRQQQLDVLASPIVAMQLLPALCQSPALARHFTEIRLHWPSSNDLQPDDLIQGRYGLIWMRAEQLKAVLHNFETYYTEVLANPDYPVFWVSQAPISAWTAQFLQQQQIGLLADRNSYSGYQLPLASLQQPGHNSARLNIRFYADRQSLADAFARREISLYPAVLLSASGAVVQQGDSPPYYDSQGQLLDQAQLRQMSGASNGGSFYLHQSLNDLGCELARLLNQHSGGQGQVKQPCR